MTVDSSVLNSRGVSFGIRSSDKAHKQGNPYQERNIVVRVALCTFVRRNRLGNRPKIFG